jgi:hypothetical protein
MVVVVIGVAAAAVLVSVVVLALGRGGGLAEVHPDHPPLQLPSGRPLVGTDVALLRLPRGLWGYHVGVTDEALARMAHALTERDALVAHLQQRLAEVQQASDTGEEEPDTWFTVPDELNSETIPGSGSVSGSGSGSGSEPEPWVAPAEFGHAGALSPQNYGPRPLREVAYGARDELHSDAVAPEDR